MWELGKTRDHLIQLLGLKLGKLRPKNMELVQGHKTRLWDCLATTASQDFLLKYFKSERVLVLGGGGGGGLLRVLNLFWGFLFYSLNVSKCFIFTPKYINQYLFICLFNFLFWTSFRFSEQLEW